MKRQLEEALSKAKAIVGVERVVQAREQGYQQGRVDTLEYLRKVLVTLAQEFQEDSYFEAYLHYVDERQQAEAEGQNPEEVEIVPPSSEGDGPGDEATNPLDADAETPEDEVTRTLESPICKAPVFLCSSFFFGNAVFVLHQ